MKIEINLKIILLVILFILLNQLDLYVLFIAFILCHELSHMVCGMLLGFEPKTLQLNPLGVSIEFYDFSDTSTQYAYKRILTYIAGPMCNFVLAFLLYFLPIEDSLKEKMVYTNLLIGIFNLIPILPLDGGKILKEILRKIYSPKTASILMLQTTKMVLILLTLGYSIAIFHIKNFALFLLVLYLWYLYLLEERRERLFIQVYETVKRH